jgi:hypothetical protein
VSARDEIAKAAERGQELSRDEVALEQLRDKIHGTGASAADRKAFKRQAAKVAKARTAARVQREAEGPPSPKPGDAVVRPGSAQ